VKILFPIGIFYPATVGGPSSSLYWHSCFLKKRGFECYVVATNLRLDPRHNIPLTKWFENEAGNVIFCKTKNHKFPFRAWWETISKIPKSDVVHYSSAYYSLSLLTILFSLIFRKKIILSPRGEFFPNAIDSFIKRIAIEFYKVVSKFILFHATSKAEYKAIKKIFPKAKIVIQPNFVNIDVYEKTKVENKDLLFLGIIYAVKRIENIIKAISISKRFSLTGSKFLIAGNPLAVRDEGYLKELKKLVTELKIEGKVQFVGEVFGQEKLDLLRKAYVLMLASDSENFGNVVVEAMSQSTPVIASKGTPWSILQEKEAGWWVDNDPASIARAIDEALLLDEKEYLNMAKRAYDLVLEKYHIETSNHNDWPSIYNFKKHL